jgi:hypothetical protein
MAEVDATPLQPTAEEAEHEAVTEANVEAYTARRYGVADSETGTLIGDIEMVRKAYVALLPTDPKVRRQELVALANVLAGHINDGDVKQLRLAAALERIGDTHADNVRWAFCRRAMAWGTGALSCTDHRNVRRSEETGSINSIRYGE